LALEPNSGPAAVPLAELLVDQRRLQEAYAVTAPLAARTDADLHVLTRHALTLKALGQRDGALVFQERAIAAAPASGVAEHNLASTLGDLEHFPQSAEACRRAFAKGLDAPETWLVYARALLGQGLNPEAETAYRQVIARRPDHVEAHGELAQLVWMMSDDGVLAAQALDAAIGRFPNLQALRLKKAELLQTAGDLEAAYDAVAGVVARADAEPTMHVIAARFSLQNDPQRALRHALDGVRLAPGNLVAMSTLCEARLALGEPAAAQAIAEEIYRRDPLDQHAIGLLATTWRALDDPRYRALYDYDRLVRPAQIDTPDGWSTLGAYLADLTESLARLHTLRTHPVGQSVRLGSQTSQRLTLVDDPAVQAFFTAIDGPIRRYIQALGPGEDPVRSRTSGQYRFNGEWSVRLREGGHHAGHLHPRGWLSSACYIALPGAIERGREGWLKFGEPGIRTEPPMPAEHFVKPEPGLLVLFPSYMWHGTVPFSGDEPRLTIAFDVVPA
jgi:tetratricopeptide (TPR) repeat protein